MTRDYQQDGFVSGFDTKALAEANRQVNSAKRAIPEALRGEYVSRIRGLRTRGGYAWEVVRK